MDSGVVWGWDHSTHHKQINIIFYVYSGSGKGKHKIVQFFWQVSSVPKYMRSSIDRVQLCLVFKEKLLKKYSYAELLRPLINDLLTLENRGIDVSLPFSRNVKAGLLLYSGDNLESHAIGGFSTSFSSKSICRHCHCQYDDLQDHISDYDGDEIHAPWTIAEYDNLPFEDEADNFVSDVYEEVDSNNLFTEFDEPTDNDCDPSISFPESESYEDRVDYGVKYRCVFNKLESFHCITSMPPDSMHDLMEGVIPQDLLGIIRILIQLDWFSLDDYNTALKQYRYSSQEAANKPQELPRSQTVKKLSGKAVSNWVHCRNFPIILFLNGWIIDDKNDVFRLALLLHDLTERITAEVFRPYEVETLEEILIEYIELRKIVFEMYPVIGRAKPKHHFLLHYPLYIMNFGPPSSYWTGRYESKHRVAKSTAEASKNFINITHTISLRQQYRMCSVYHHGMFKCEKFVLPTVVKTKEELNPDEVELGYGSLLRSGDILSSSIEYRARQYKIGDVVVLGRHDKLVMDVGITKGFVVKRGDPYLIVRRSCMQLHKYRFFTSVFTQDKLECVKFQDLHDTYPLLLRGSEEKFIVSLHHHISFSYD